VKNGTPTSLRSLVVQAVIDLGEATTAQVLARMGLHIPANRAAMAARRKFRMDARAWGRRTGKESVAKLVQLGRRRLVSENLVRAVKLGYLSRARINVYCAPRDG
jgi:hypothetical protein